VLGRDTRAIRSQFGASRDGGRRSHHGVDIFAPRGTPVVAASRGRVSWVGSSRLGGRVVWLREREMGYALYYAHLDSQAVRRGTVVAPGDTLGFVGNSGNARTTPPHLHFGIYLRGTGPVDPFPFLHRPEEEPLRLSADDGRLGRWVRASGDGVRLRRAPSPNAGVVRELSRHTALKVVAATASWTAASDGQRCPGRQRPPRGGTGSWRVWRFRIRHDSHGAERLDPRGVSARGFKTSHLVVFAETPACARVVAPLVRNCQTPIVSSILYPARIHNSKNAERPHASANSLGHRQSGGRGC
jgi:hypothetical protein